MKDLNPEMFSQEGAEVSIIPVMTGEVPVKVDETSLPDTLPLLTLRNAVIFPGAIFPVTIGREKSMKLIQDAHKHNSYIGTVPQNDVSVEDPKLEDLFPFGTVARIIKTFEMPDGTISAVLQGLKRFEIENIVSEEPYLRATVHYLEDLEADPNQKDVKLIADALKEKAITIVKSSSYAPKEAATALKAIDDFSFLVNFIATTIDVDNFNDKVALLKFEDMKTRAMQLLNVLDTQVELLKIKQEINAKVKTEIDQQQREYYLNNQLRTIQEELGMDEDEDLEKLRAEAAKKDWPKYAMDAFQKEMAKLEKYNPTTPDYSIQYNYVKFMLELPWNDMSKDNLDLKHAQKVLDSDHFGLEKVKERIIEYLAVLKLRGDMKSPILCLYGPPGVGKTSLGKSIAKAVGRKYVRIALGGMHDEAEIRGHRKTYVGALPGRILNGINKAGTSNPVMVLDEIDKLSSDFKGDPSSALLEVLDPEQNGTFHDNYLDLDYDLSHVLFITTANDISTIQPALLDRMELINVTGYLAEEKMEIAKKFLVPKELKEHGIDKKELKIDKAALTEIIDKYTHESGVRGLEKQIAKVARVTAKKIAMGDAFPPVIKKEHLKEYLGLPSAFHDKQDGNEGVGVVTGLAWTQMGGEILFVESSVSEGKGQLTMTGNLGNVMKESATIAYQYIKAHPQMAGITSKEFDAKDIHVHVPEGATPKDGPSAGITLVSSMVSALRGQAIKKGIAMTGEMTLRGRVLPVGGIKEKILAAKRAGVTTIVISEDNRKDIEDINEVYVQGLTFHYVKNIDDVIKFIFK
ncbi:MAG: endopeptidase La [Bacteroides sp.]|nr:endopeptidase La [Bacteroidales bacterium]MCI7462628.1 endopeptidase La [Bacteroides sp.]MDY2973815.1 endopeptidase La [Candidatus Cryptobacteroides sp.]MED9899765.1 endopeptidase La [Bacteroidales bacterium]